MIAVKVRWTEPKMAPNSSGPFLIMIMLCFAAIAILRSPRSLHTALYISGMMIAGGALGAGVGFLRSPELAG